MSKLRIVIAEAEARVMNDTTWHGAAKTAIRVDYMAMLDEIRELRASVATEQANIAGQLRAHARIAQGAKDVERASAFRDAARIVEQRSIGPAGAK